MPYDVGERIVIVRRELGLGVVEFSRKANISNSIIYEAEAGTKEMGLTSLARLSKTYGISLNWLVFGLGPMYLKDTQMPFRGDAMEVMGKNFPVTEAPGLAEILQDQQLTAQLGISIEEIQFLCKNVKDLGPIARTFDRDWWLDIIHRIRQAKLTILDDLRRELRKAEK